MAARHRGKYMHSSNQEVNDYEEYYENDEDDEEDPPECVTWCGNPMYPHCKFSCKLWDDEY